MTYDFTNDIAKLKRALKKGLPKCYNDRVNDFSLDWAMDLPWDREGRMDAAEAILKSPEAMRVVWAFDAKFYTCDVENSMSRFLYDAFQGKDL